MTLQELSRYYQLRERLARNNEMLASLEAEAQPKSPALTGMPHTPGVSDKVGDLAIEIADIKERIRFLKEEIAREDVKVSAFIASIENDQTRLIFRLRFIRCLTWGQVAAVIGGRNSEDGVKAICYRYLSRESCNGVSPCVT